MTGRAGPVRHILRQFLNFSLPCLALPCLAFAWSKARAQRAHAYPDDPEKVVRVMVRPTPEGVAAIYAAITGRDVSPEDMARLAQRLTAVEN